MRRVDHHTLLLLASATFSVCGADLAELIIPQGVGVNIHFTRGHERDLEMIAAAGIKWVRMDFTWSATERKKGEYNWSAYEELTANLEKRGIRPYYILDYSNPLYEEVVVSKNPITGREQKGCGLPAKHRECGGVRHVGRCGRPPLQWASRHLGDLERTEHHVLET